MSNPYDPYKYKCKECGCTIDERYQTLRTRVTGWTKKRSQGGANHIAQQRPTNDFRCDVCMQKVLSGDDINQCMMFGSR